MQMGIAEDGDAGAIECVEIDWKVPIVLVNPNEEIRFEMSWKLRSELPQIHHALRRHYVAGNGEPRLNCAACLLTLAG